MNQLKVKNEVLESVAYFAGLTLDVFEAQMGHTKEWPFIRSRLLKIFGDRGLKGRVEEIFNSNSQGGIK